MKIEISAPKEENPLKKQLSKLAARGQAIELFGYLRDNIVNRDYNTFRWSLNELKILVDESDDYTDTIIEAFTL